jgi:D-glycero-D-manno-heptose 1,7-bisphosphate phosphatase
VGINKGLKAFFLDRDGVLNKSIVTNNKPYPPINLSELVIPKGLKKSLKELKELDYLLIMVTNQPDVARGTKTKEVVDQINNYLKVELCLDDVFCCFHDDPDNCDCRKPKIGMILSACKKWNIDISKSFMVGDRWKDIQCGKNAGLTTFLLEKNYNEKRIKPDHSVSKFSQILNLIKYIKNE